MKMKLKMPLRSVLRNASRIPKLSLFLVSMKTHRLSLFLVFSKGKKVFLFLNFRPCLQISEKSVKNIKNNFEKTPQSLLK